MKYDANIHRRRSIRLKEYDYADQGAYYVTTCTWNRECNFGKIIDTEINLSEYGEIACREWMKSSEIRREIELDEFIVMPNHVHAIVFINGNRNVAPDVGANGRSPLRMQSRSLSSFMAGFKSASTKSINILRNTPGIPVWQRNYYERVIRNEYELNRIRKYIMYNPERWMEDENNPVNIVNC